jgi:hypothetical protein
MKTERKKPTAEELRKVGMPEREIELTLKRWKEEEEIRAQLNEAYERRCRAIAELCDAYKERDIQRTMARYEYESDERMTARDKALSTMESGTIYARY